MTQYAADDTPPRLLEDALQDISMNCTFARSSRRQWEYAIVKERAFGGRRPTHASWRDAPRYRSENLRIVIDDAGVVVAGATVYDLRLRYGDATLRMGGIGDVATDPAEQGRGYAGACMRDTVEFMTNDGYDLSVLYSLPPDYYTRFGYRTALLYSCLRVNARDIAESSLPGFRSRAPRRADAETVDRIRKNACRNCDYMRFRTPEDWKWDLQPRVASDARVLVDESGEVVAYLMTNQKPDVLYISEVATIERDDVYAATLAAIRELAGNALHNDVDIFTPPGSGFAAWCFYRARAREHAWTDWNNGPMVRLLNVESVFTKIEPTLARRWNSAPRDVAPTAVTLRTPTDCVALEPTARGLAVRAGATAGSVVEVPGEALTELVMGFRPAADILRDAHVDAETLHVLEVLFPVAKAFLPPTDKF